MSSKEANQEPEIEYLEDGYLQDDGQQSDAFFALDEEDPIYEERERAGRTKLLMAGLLLIAVLGAGLLGIFGIRSYNAANEDAPYADKTWVMQGTFKDLTPDLNTKSNVAVYSGALPTDTSLTGKTYSSNINDPSKVTAGQTIEFRGSQIGKSKADFMQNVDGLLAVDAGGQLEVIRTAEQGTMKPITADSVQAERVTAIAQWVGAALLVGLGITGAILLARRGRRAVEDS